MADVTRVFLRFDPHPTDSGKGCKDPAATHSLAACSALLGEFFG